MDDIKIVSESAANLNTFAAIMAILEGGCVYGDNASARKIIQLCKAEIRKQIVSHDAAMERAKS